MCTGARILCGVFLIAAVGALAGPAQGANMLYVPTSDTDWHNRLNWTNVSNPSDHRVPISGDIARMHRSVHGDIYSPAGCDHLCLGYDVDTTCSATLRASGSLSTTAGIYIAQYDRSVCQFHQGGARYHSCGCPDLRQGKRRKG